MSTESSERHHALGEQPGGCTRGSSVHAGWSVRGGEPRLDELVSDPIMDLLWQRDRLEPSIARARLSALRAMVRKRRQHEHRSAAAASLGTAG
jgi:hypothetical protein